MALHKKQETICLELANKHGLTYCFWQWGRLEHARGNCQGEYAKLSAALALFTELAMPRERDSVQAELGAGRRFSDLNLPLFQPLARTIALPPWHPALL